MVASVRHTFLPILCCASISTHVLGQSIDSLRQSLAALEGESLGMAYARMARNHIKQQADSTLHYAELAARYLRRGSGAALRNELARISALQQLNRFEEAISLGEAVLKKARAMEDPSLLGEAYEQHAASFSARKEVAEATRALYRAEAIYAQTGNLKGAARVKTGIANLYKTGRKFEQAKKMHLEALDALLQLGDEASAVRSCFHVTLLYNIVQQYDSAFFYAKKMVSLGQRTRSIFGQTRGYQMAGNALIKMGNYPEALSYLDSAYQLAIRTPLAREAKRALLDKGYAYLYQHQYDKAEQIGRQLLTDPQNPDIGNTYRLLHKSYRQSGHYKQAYQYLHFYKNYLDSINTRTMRSRFEEMQAKYEAEKKEAKIYRLGKEVQIAELESSQNRYYFIGASIIGALILGISAIALNQQRLKQKADLAQEQFNNAQLTMKLENELRESELKALKSQMNPHFIFNALNSIQEYIILNDKENAANYLGKFADLIRNYLYHSNTGKITLADEMEGLQLYLELEQLRFGADFQFEIKKDLRDSADNLDIPTMLIQPYVENAIKHGLLHKSGQKRLSLQFIEHETTLQCLITDNGIGREKSAVINARQRQRHQSFATQATQTRLELLNHQSETKIGVQIDDLKDGDIARGTQVRIHIPLV